MITSSGQAPAPSLWDNVGGNIGAIAGKAVRGAVKGAQRGGDVAVYNRIANGDAHTVRDAQDWLRSKGYSLAADGIFGPQTSRALKASFNNIHPNAHNTRENAIQNKHPQTGKFQTSAPAGGGGGGGGKPPKMRGGGGGKGGGGGGIPSSAPGVFDPAAMAHGMANEEFNPAIASLKQMLGNVGIQDDYNQKQIAGYYKQMSNLMNQQSADQGDATQQALQNVTGDMGNVAQLFGASNAQQMQPAVGNATGLLATEGKSQQDYLANMLPLLQAQGAQSTKDEQSTAASQLANYQNQLTQQQHAKGQAYNADYQNALSQQATQQQNALALQQAQALMPYQIGSAQAQLKVDRANANSAGAYNAGKLAIQKAQIGHYGALNAEEHAQQTKALAEAKKASQAAAPGDKASVLAPGSTTADRIQKNLYRSMTNSSGKITITNPVRAQHALYDSAVKQGLITRSGHAIVPGAIGLLNSTLQEMYQRDAAWQANWKWNGSKFVPK